MPEDVFDFMGRKIASTIFDVAVVFDRFQEPYRSGAIAALEEFCFRMNGKNFDWDKAKQEALDQLTAEFEAAMKEPPATEAAPAPGNVEMDSQ